MDCPLCDYVMDAFDRECPRCHGQGLAPKTPPAAPPTAMAAPKAPPPFAPKSAAPVAPPSAPLQGVPAHVAAANAPGAALPYFFALTTNKVYRVYLDADALLFVQAGGEHPNIVNVIRAAYGENGDGGLAMGGAVARTSVVAAQTMGAAGGVGLGLAAGALHLVYAVNADNLMRKRAQTLDPMSADELRAEAAKRGCIVQADNTSGVVLRPPKTWSWTDSNVYTGYLTFHNRAKKTRKWKMILASQTDAELAVREFRRIVGAGVEVKFPF